MKSLRLGLALAVALLAGAVQNGLGAGGAPALPPLRVSDNQHFLTTAEGQPFFWLADTA